MNYRFLLLLIFALSVHTFNYAQNELSLDGQWEIIFDETNEGRFANWYRDSIFQMHPEKKEIKVPSPIPASPGNQNSRQDSTSRQTVHRLSHDLSAIIGTLDGLDLPQVDKPQK